MALIIEDGTGVAGSDSYGTRAGFIAHALNYYGATVPDVDASDVPMRSAFAWLAGQSWKGTKTYGRGQTGAWPRTSVVDCEDIAIAVDEVPSEVIQAQYDLAYAEYVTQGVLSPTGSIRDTLVSMEKIDVLAIEYDTSRIAPGQDVTAVRVEAALRLIGCFLNGGGRLVRMTDAVAV